MKPSRFLNALPFGTVGVVPHQIRIAIRASRNTAIRSVCVGQKTSRIRESCPGASLDDAVITMEITGFRPGSEDKIRTLKVRFTKFNFHVKE